MSDNLTPQQILDRLDTYVVGQAKAKRAVAVALRNRWRRRQLDSDTAADVYPKNILLIGPTGVGKTEIARRLAVLSRSPFVKVEATKYSEVGYHGRDVESMVRDLAESAVAIVRREHADRVQEDAYRHADERVLATLCQQRGFEPDSVSDAWRVDEAGLWRPTTSASGDPLEEDTDESDAQERERLRAALAADALDDQEVEIEVRDTRTPTVNIMGPQGNDAMGIDAAALQEMMGRTTGTRTKLRRLAIREARQLLREEEAEKLVDEEAIFQEAIERTENDGIVFIDEVDKVIGGGAGDGGPDVSREGVQRDLLSIVEGCAVYTRYGHVRTDHILFIAAGAFHFHKPSELIPELQGRFPVRVALRPLTEDDFLRILTEPRNSLVRQYTLLFETEGVALTFAKDGLSRLAELAFRANQTTQNIGARRLFTILEKCLEDLSFQATSMRGHAVVVDRDLVDRQLGETADDEDLIQYDV